MNARTYQLLLARMKRNANTYPPYANLHTVVGVLREEYMEFEQEVFKHDRDLDQVEAELIDIAAACLGAVDQLTPETVVRADRVKLTT